MKSLRPAMARLHSWTGLLLTALMYFIFVTGTTGYFQFELNRWLQPERPLAAQLLPGNSFRFPTDAQHTTTRTTSDLIDLAYKQLAVEAGAEASWWGILLPDIRHGNLWIEWQPPRQAGGSRPPRQARFLAFDEQTQPYWVTPRSTGGGEALYRLHWRLHYLPEPLAYWIVGLVTLFLLVGLISGVIVHRKLLTEFFTLRLFRQARSWLDLHNLSSVMALPFLVMISYSGLLFFIVPFLQPVIGWHYADSPKPTATFDQQAFPTETPRRKLSQSAQQYPLSELYQRHQTFSDKPLTQLYVLHPTDVHARVSLYLPQQTPASHQHEPERILLDGPSGERLQPAPPTYSAVAATYDTLLELHEGHFAAPGTRLLYGLSGGLGCLMIASGVIFWLRKPRPNKAFPELQAKMFAVILLGLPLGVAAYFWANRLLPPGFPQRDEWELHCLFIAWISTALFTLCTHARRSWVILTQLAGASWLLLPVLNAMTSDRHLWASLAAQDWVLAAIDISMLLIGSSFLTAASLYSRQLNKPIANSARTSHRIPSA